MQWYVKWIATFILGLAPLPALAYLDPSVGSMVISAIVGLAASLALAVKTYWYRIKRLFGRGRGAESGSRKAGP